jgi:hypothetical protein
MDVTLTKGLRDRPRLCISYCTKRKRNKRKCTKGSHEHLWTLKGSPKIINWHFISPKIKRQIEKMGGMSRLSGLLLLLTEILTVLSHRRFLREDLSALWESSSKSSSVSSYVVSSRVCSLFIETSRSRLSGGRLMCCWAKYGMRRKAAVSQSNSEPSSSATIYAPPLLREVTMIGPVYRAHIFRFNAFSIAVCRSNTRSPSLKLKSRIVFWWSLSNRIAAFRLAWKTIEWSVVRSSCRFCSKCSSSDHICCREYTVEPGRGSRYEASDMLKGSRGWVPVTAK